MAKGEKVKHMRDSEQPVAHLMHGFVGAGKTTFARKLEAETGAVRFTHDEWMHRLYGENPPADCFFNLYDRVDGMIWDYASRLLALGQSVILDSGFWTREVRDAARRRVVESGAIPRLYFIDTPEPIMRERMQNRSDALPEDSLLINGDAFDGFKTRFQPLEPDEEHIYIDGSQ